VVNHGPWVNPGLFVNFFDYLFGDVGAKLALVVVQVEDADALASWLDRFVELLVVLEVDLRLFRLVLLRTCLCRTTHLGEEGSQVKRGRVLLK